MLAVLGSHTDCVHLLLEKGATADAGDKRGRTALHRGVRVTLVFKTRLRVPVCACQTWVKFTVLV